VTERALPLLVLQHASWEQPHRILDAFGGVDVMTVRPLRDEPLPAHDEVAGTVAMGGPMSADDDDRYPELAGERRWLAEAVERGMPVLGICLGSQLLAMALGAEVRRRESPEVGFAPIETFDGDDPLVGRLAPSATVLHWHSDVFDLPEGATPLARSEQTGLQGFRIADSWGILFHPEADASLVDDWLAVSEMEAEAITAVGPGAVAILRRQAREHEDDLIARTRPGFAAFAELVASRVGKREGR
jgi:GMP synthase (glutamine-hydrolysing)